MKVQLSTMNRKKLEDVISNFEANCLDGDKIQEGQMIASTEIKSWIEDCLPNVLHSQLQDTIPLKTHHKKVNSAYHKGLKEGRADLEDKIAEARENVPDTVDRIEVIDNTGRGYVRGAIYGTPIKAQLMYQDDNRTLKVFVLDRTENKV